MICKVKQGKTFYGCCRYTMEKKGAEVLYAKDVRTRSAVEASSDFEMIANLRPNRKSKVVHLSVSFAYSDNLKVNNELMINVGKRILEELDLDKSQSLIVRHNDTNHMHFHIVSNLVRYDGSVASDKFIKNRAARASDILENEFDLTVARLQKQEQKSIYLNSQLAKEKSEVKRLIDLAEDKGISSLKDLTKFLSDNNVSLVIQKQSTGRINGISFKKGSFAFKGSSLGKDYSYSKLTKKFEKDKDNSIEI